MNEYLILTLWVVVVGAAFVYAWRKGYLQRLTGYTQETQQELKKCTWPSLEELKGSTVVVIVAFVLMSVFTVGLDLVFAYFIRQII